MGNSADGLKPPFIEKRKGDFVSTYFNVGLSEMQGWRSSMEDASLIHISQHHKDENTKLNILPGNVPKQHLNSDSSEELQAGTEKTIGTPKAHSIDRSAKVADLVTNYLSSQISIFGVFDGHGGSLVSQFVSDNFMPMFMHSSAIKRRESSASGLLKTNQQSLRYSEGSTALNIIEQILIQTFLDLDQMLMTKESYLAMKQYKEGKRNDLVISDIDSVFNDMDQYFSCTSESAAYMMGTTANVISVYGGYAVVANVGDSLAVLYDEGKAIILNTEHKVSIEGEKERILNSGFQIHNGRIDGRLNLTRAIGDLQFKDKKLRPYEQAVTAYPEILTYELTPTSEFLVIACDGIWDCVEPQKFCEFISAELKKQVKISDIIGNIQDMVLSKTINSPIGTDNMTCIVVQLKSFIEN